MRTFLTTTLSCLALAALPAAALEKEFVDQIMQSAQNIERDASEVSRALKTKSVDKPGVTAKIDAMSGDLTKLKQLVSQFEAGNPQLSERDKADWEMLKAKVQLLEIFHDRKKTLAAEDLGKHRGAIRAHANGVALRAQKLQQTASKLRRG